MSTKYFRAQFAGMFDRFIAYTEAFDAANAATGSGTFSSTDITVPGVVLGDMVLFQSLAVDTVDVVIAAAVTAADTVTVTVLNNTAGAVNLASATLRLLVGKPSEQYFVV